MRKLLIGLFLSLVAASANAEWVLVAEGNNGDKFYADPKIINREGSTIKLWVLTSYAKPKAGDGKSYQSDSIYQLFDCVYGTVQPQTLTSYVGKMGNGEMVRLINRSGAATAAAPNSSAAFLLKFACSLL